MSLGGSRRRLVPEAWTPRWGRRGFLWLGGMAVAGAAFGWPEAESEMVVYPPWTISPPYPWHSPGLRVGDLITIEGRYLPNTPTPAEFLITGVTPDGFSLACQNLRVQVNG